MSTENNNLFTDFEPLKNAGMSNAVDFSASEPISGLTDGISSRFQGLIPEPTDALFDKMWESCGSLNNSVPSTPVSSLNDQKEFQPISPDAFMRPVSVLEGRGSAPIFDDVLPEQNRSTRRSAQPTQIVPSESEIAYLERMWETGEFPNHETNQKSNVLSNEELELRIEESDRLLSSTRSSKASFDSVEIPQLLESKADDQEKNREELEARREEQSPSQSSTDNSPRTVETEPAARTSKSWGGWTLSLISAVLALIVGLFIFGWNMLPAYLVQCQIQEATGLSLRMDNVQQDYRAGITKVESIQAFDSAQRPFFETGRTTFSSSLPYFVGNNNNMNWAMVEGIRFAPTPSYVNPNAASLRDNEFNKALKSVGKELDDSQMDLLVKNSVSTISSPYEQTIRRAEQEVKDITKQIQVLQERLLSSGEEATDADKAQATSYQQRMKMALSDMSIEESLYNQRNAALLNNLSSKRDQSRAESNVPAVTNGVVTEYLFGQDYTAFTGQFLYEIRQFCRWLPKDLEKALGPVDKLDPSALSFRRIETQEQLAVGQIRLTGQTQFMNQTVPFSAVITNYSTKPNGKPLVLDVAFGEDQSARLRMEARRGENRTEIKVEYASSNVNPGALFGLEDGLHVKLEPDEKTPFIQTRSIQFIVADGKIQGEYAMAQTAPSVSIGVSGVRSESNVERLNQLVQNVEKITLNGTISGLFSKPELRVSSNLESLGITVLTVAANEYDQRMDEYRTAIEKKSSELIEQDQKRIAKIAEDVKVSANGNALLLNQLCSGVVDSQIVVEKEPANAESELEQETTDEVKLADSEDDLTLPSVEEVTENDADQTVSPEDMPFPELPVPEAEPAQASAQIAAGDVMVEDLPPLEAPETAMPMAPESNVTQAAPQTEQNVPVEMVEEYPELPVLPSVEDLLSEQADGALENQQTNSETQETVSASPSQVFGELPSLEELAPQSGIPMTAPQTNDNSAGVAINVNSKTPTELQTLPGTAMEINSPDANYESPEMEFMDDDNMDGLNSAAPMEEALPEEEIIYEETVPMVAPNTDSNVSSRKTPPALPLIIDEE